MKNILVIGAGRSSTALINYLLENSQSRQWKVAVADFSPELAQSRINNHPNAVAIAFDIKIKAQRESEISKPDIVISLLPPGLHELAAADCIRFKKNLITASYVSEAIKKMDAQAVSAGVLLLNECGLDPGIDHMSAMQVIDKLKSENADIISFKSYTGGLIAPECNDNPWGYKFTWNPYNVIVAGWQGAMFIKDGLEKYVPYKKLFSEIEKVKVEDAGTFDGYANRDSLQYRKQYDLENIQTLLRGTLRNEGFCEAWNIFVQLGLTDDIALVMDSEKLSYKDWVESCLPENISGRNAKEKVAVFTGVELNSAALAKVAWTGIFSEEKVNLSRVTSAQILLDLLERKWKLKENDRDMIVMQHEFVYRKNGRKEKLISSLVVKGDDAGHTSMAKTVGLPMGIAAKLLLEKKINLTGVKIPVMKEIYEPVLKELNQLGIKFNDVIKAQ